ncbi:PTS transporter subunit EIIB [Schaalia canis]|uniref:PTS sugar transporter subunit IIBC n=1 Tax=Schaalia canis TaxID=100469 RepID=A0A3P1SCQ0_9ACTO|nr:PTS transporter subunit EIIB [Schaalia canis]RRC94826.1 PTS sugar transporter subunit IIBC [Schaalia canis]
MEKEIAQALVDGLGGASNIAEIESCMVRIRVEVHNPLKVNDDALRVGPVIALVRVDEVIQIVAGEASEELAAHMLQLCKAQEENLSSVTAPRHAS